LQNEMNRAFQRIGDQAGALALLESSPRVCWVDTRRHVQMRVDVETSELRERSYSIKSAGHRASKRRPWQPRRVRDRPKRQDEAVTDGTHEKRLWRPAIARTTEFGR